MIERRVYNGYAFSDNEFEKMKMNREIYDDLMKKYRILRDPPDGYNPDEYDLIYTRKPGYGHAIYALLKNDTPLYKDDLLLIFDDGNLCFGGSFQGGNTYRVSED